MSKIDEFRCHVNSAPLIINSNLHGAFGPTYNVVVAGCGQGQVLVRIFESILLLYVTLVEHNQTFYPS